MLINTKDLWDSLILQISATVPLSAPNNLASMYESMGRYEDAEPLYRQAMEIRRQALGEQHPDFGQSLNNMAGLYFSMGRYAEAKPLYRQAMEIAIEALGRNHPNTKTVQASYENVQRKLDDAFDLKTGRSDPHSAKSRKRTCRHQEVTPLEKRTERVPITKPGRNAPCPSGSGRKYKNCCMRRR